MVLDVEQIVDEHHDKSRRLLKIEVNWLYWGITK